MTCLDISVTSLIGYETKRSDCFQHSCTQQPITSNNQHSFVICSWMMFLAWGSSATTIVPWDTTERCLPPVKMKAAFSLCDNLVVHYFNGRVNYEYFWLSERPCLHVGFEVSISKRIALRHEHNELYDEKLYAASAASMLLSNAKAGGIMAIHQAHPTNRAGNSYTVELLAGVHPQVIRILGFHSRSSCDWHITTSITIEIRLTQHEERKSTIQLGVVS